MALQRQQIAVNTLKESGLVLTDECEPFLEFIFKTALINSQRPRISGNIGTISKFGGARRMRSGSTIRSNMGKSSVNAYNAAVAQFSKDLLNFAQTNNAKVIDSALLASFLKYICPRWPFC